MQLSGDYTFNGPRDVVWDLLQDPDVLKAAMPGAKSLDKTGEDEYKADIQVRVGPVNGVFATTITLSDKTPPEQYTMLVDSKGSTGFARGSAVVTLTEQDAETTVMHYDANLQVGGRIASVGQRMLDTVSKSLTRQSLEAMNNALEARLRGGSPDGEADGATEDVYTPPSQTEFALNVAQDVAAETIRSNPVLWVGGAVAVGIVLGWLLFRD